MCVCVWYCMCGIVCVWYMCVWFVCVCGIVFCVFGIVCGVCGIIGVCVIVCVFVCVHGACVVLWVCVWYFVCGIVFCVCGIVGVCGIVCVCVCAWCMCGMWGCVWYCVCVFVCVHGACVVLWGCAFYGSSVKVSEQLSVGSRDPMRAIRLCSKRVYLLSHLTPHPTPALFLSQGLSHSFSLTVYIYVSTGFFPSELPVSRLRSQTQSLHFKMWILGIEPRSLNSGHQE